MKFLSWVNHREIYLKGVKMKGATERWLVVNGKDVAANIFPTEQMFYIWAANSMSTCDIHPDCEGVEKAVFEKTQQRVKLYRVNRMLYIGFLFKDD